MKKLFLTSIMALSTTLVQENWAYGQGSASTEKPATSLPAEASADVKTCLSGSSGANANINDKCIAMIYAAGYSGHFDNFTTDRDGPADKSFECKRLSPLHQDWDACNKAIKTYTTMLGLDGAMQIASKVQSQMANAKLQKEVTEKAAKGNLQTAALEATADKNKSDAGILQQQMTFYGSQAAALEKQVAAWPTKIKTVCKSKNLTTAKKDFIRSKTLAIQNHLTPPQGASVPDNKLKTPVVVKGVTVLNAKGDLDSSAFSEASCEKILSILSDGELFANGNARGFLQAKAIEAVGKAVAAGLNASKLKQNAKIADGLADQYTDPGGDAMFELCAVDPANVKCRSNGPRVNQGAYQAGQFDLGGGGAGQAFNLNPNAGSGEEIGNIGTTEGNKVSGISSPFGEDAKEAAGLLDQAGGASYTSAGAGSGGGVGGGGGGGGGSAALGSDLQGADKDEKEAEIKASKRDGGYGSGGGAGFAATGGGSGDEENPLKSLFDQEGAKGGIEEDRSIASEDIDSSNSALFERISKRYSKVHGEKRIEANNLE